MDYIRHGSQLEGLFEIVIRLEIIGIAKIVWVKVICLEGGAFVLQFYI